jgi:GMP reductase
MRIEQDIKLDFKDVLIRPKRSTLSSRKDVDLNRTFIFKNSGQTWTGVPIVASNMDTTGTFEMAKELQKHNMFTCLHKYYTLDDWKTNIDDLNAEYFSVSIGITERDMEYLDTIITSFPQVKFICLDVANGYQESFVKAVKRVHSNYPKRTIIAGNVVTGEMVEELILAGADIIKCGIGSGALCSTRLQTGVGYPQLSTVIECADAAHGMGGHIISDGGCVVPGDVAKALGGGADFVMLGGVFGGHEESGGDTIYDSDGKAHKLIYGMSSDTAMKKYKGDVARYRSSEGITRKVEYKGPVENTVLDMLGGIRSTCTYVGARQLKELCKRTTFVRVTQQVNPHFHK